MKKNTGIAFALIAGFMIFVSTIVIGSPPFPLIPYPHLDRHPPSKPRLLAVPVGCDKLLSRGCEVTSSDPGLTAEERSYITDGDKQYDAVTYVELAPGLQWIQIDLGKELEIHAVCIWHSQPEYGLMRERACRDVICQISNDSEFTNGVVTVFNNDHDNSAGFGVGKDMEYIASHRYGRPFAVDAVKGRYVRCYGNGYIAPHANGNRVELLNQYIEIEVFGKPLDEPTASPKVIYKPPEGKYGDLPEPPPGKTWLRIEPALPPPYIW